jgi:hypothetical protein
MKRGRVGSPGPETERGMAKRKRGARRSSVSCPKRKQNQHGGFFLSAPGEQVREKDKCFIQLDRFPDSFHQGKRCV